MHDLRMPDVNSVLIAGNLTRDPAFRKTTNGTPVANFWIASNRRFKDNTGQWRENVCYVGVVAWYKLAENCANNLKKGSAVVIEGELQSRSLRTDDGRNRNIVEIKARRVQFLDRKESHEAGTLDLSDEMDVEYNNRSDGYTSGDDASDGDNGFESHSDDSAPSEPSERRNSQRGRFDFGYQNLEL